METAWSGPFSILLTISSFYSSLTRCCCCCCKGCFLFPCYSARADQSGRKSHITPSLRRPFFFFFFLLTFSTGRCCWDCVRQEVGFAFLSIAHPNWRINQWNETRQSFFYLKRKKELNNFFPGAAILSSRASPTKCQTHIETGELSSSAPSCASAPKKNTHIFLFLFFLVKGPAGGGVLRPCLWRDDDDDEIPLLLLLLLLFLLLHNHLDWLLPSK